MDADTRMLVRIQPLLLEQEERKPVSIPSHPNCRCTWLPTKRKPLFIWDWLYWAWVALWYACTCFIVLVVALCIVCWLPVVYCVAATMQAAHDFKLACKRDNITYG